ncbi:MAG: DnaJ family molecular chaperone [Burkholderiales bacterium]
MTSTELLVTLGGLYVGYWVVAKLFAGKPQLHTAAGTHANRPNAERDTEPASPAWFTVLNVPPSATPDEIRQSYRTLVSQYHPDKVATLGAELKAVAERKSKEINVAYEEAKRVRGDIL